MANSRLARILFKIDIYKEKNKFKERGEGDIKKIRKTDDESNKNKKSKKTQYVMIGIFKPIPIGCQ